MRPQIMLVIDDAASTDLALCAEIMKDHPEDRIWYVDGDTVMDQISRNPDRWLAVEAIIIACEEPTIKVEALMGRIRTFYDAIQKGGKWSIDRRYTLVPQTAVVSLQAA